MSDTARGCPSVAAVPDYRPVRRIVFEEIDSTNAEARRRAEAGEQGPLWITARRQSAGRGRRGRAWETGEGNLAATYLFTTAKAPAEAAQISFVAALAVADLAAAFVAPDLVRLKWPNDPLVAGAKAGGVLVESGKAGEGLIWLAVGVGVNLAAAPEIVGRATTALAVHREGGAPAPDAALDVLAEALERWRAIWEGVGFGPIAEAWSARAIGLGGPCVARLATETIEGVAEGLDPDGALRLRLDDGAMRRITAGDVFFGGV